jgi:hypothetical protein
MKGVAQVRPSEKTSVVGFDSDSESFTAGIPAPGRGDGGKGAQGPILHRVGAHRKFKMSDN